MQLLILSTPRTGSNALCEVLSSGTTMGKVDAYFIGHGEELQQVYEERDHNLRSNMSYNENYATKIMWDYIDEMSKHIKTSGVMPSWLSSFTHVLRLYREDVTAQAVSWFMALGSGKWTSRDDQKRDWPEYNYNRILFHWAMIKAYDARTRAFLEGAPVPSWSISYEDIVRIGWQKVGRDIFDFVGLQPADIQPPELQKQENPLKAEYIERFNHERVVALHARGKR